MKRWLQSEEEALAQLEDKCGVYQRKHDGHAGSMRKWHLLLAGFVILLTGAAGLVGLATGAEDAPNARPSIKYSVGAANMCSAGMTWLAGKLDLGKVVEAHRSTAKSYAGLIRNIRMELNTHRRDRTTSGAAFLHICLESMNKILEEAPELKDDTVHAKISLESQ